MIGERRVATTPETVEQIQQLGYSVAVKAGAGDGRSFTDDAYREAGADVVADTRAACGRSPTSCSKCARRSRTRAWACTKRTCCAKARR